VASCLLLRLSNSNFGWWKPFSTAFILCACFWQVLRTQFMHGADGPRQTIKPASAVHISSATVEQNGTALLLPQPHGSCAIQSGTALAAAWRQAAAAPFDLYNNDALVRIQVNTWQ
jgi:hypothetical protein